MRSRSGHERHGLHALVYRGVSVCRGLIVGSTTRKAQQLKQMYDTPAINVAMTFMEVFPTGLVVTALSAGVLRKKVREP